MIQTLGLSSPFNDSSDVSLGVAYDSYVHVYTSPWHGPDP